MLTTKNTKNLAHNDHIIPDISKQVVDAAYNVHINLGPGLLESAYEACLAYELTKRQIDFERQKALPIKYKENIVIDAGYRLDFLIEDSLIVEIKSVEKLIPLYDAQLLTYLKLSNIKTGLLINFNNKLIKDGIKRLSL